MYASLTNSTGAIYSISDGKLIKKFDFGDPSYNFFQFVGWTSNSQLGYNIQKTTKADTFDGSNTSSHSYDISTSSTNDYVTSLGAMEMVLVKK